MLRCGPGGRSGDPWKAEREAPTAPGWPCEALGDAKSGRPVEWGRTASSPVLWPQGRISLALELVGVVMEEPPGT